MVSNLQTIVFVLFITTLFYSAYAITCYQCDSELNEKCDVDFDSDGIFKADCSKASIPRYIQTDSNLQLNATGCVKITVEDDVKQTIFRSCYYGVIQNENATNASSTCIMDPLDTKSRLVSCNPCIGNLCNDSTAMSPFIILVAIMLTISQLNYYRFDFSYSI